MNGVAIVHAERITSGAVALTLVLLHLEGLHEFVLLQIGSLHDLFNIFLSLDRTFFAMYHVVTGNRLRCWNMTRKRAVVLCRGLRRRPFRIKELY